MAAMLHAPPVSGEIPPAQGAPVLRVTTYDQVSSWLIALVVALVLAVICLTAAWIAGLPPRPLRAVPVELVDAPGGDEEGTLGETLRLEAPTPETADPSLAEVEAPESEIQESLDNIMELSDEATNLAEKQFEFETRNAGQAGSARGTGRRALGIGKGQGGIPRDQRWFVAYVEGTTLDEYAQQLDALGIELGVLFPDGKLVYLSNLTQPVPRTRTVTRGSDESRLYMTWQSGVRRKADAQLFARAGIDVGEHLILQFFPAKTEQTMARLELEFQNQPVERIRRTYFTVQREGNAYSLRVTRQALFN